MSNTSSLTEPVETDILALRVGRVDLRARTLYLHTGGTVALTSREQALLTRLVAGAGRVVSCEELLEDVWGRQWSGAPEELGVVRNAMFRLRQKVEVDAARPDHLMTAQGEGYAFSGRIAGRAEEPRLRVAEPPGDVWSARWDVGREREAAAAGTVLQRPHRPLVLLGSWRMGKTWLLRRLIRDLEPEDVWAIVDPRTIESEVLKDPAHLYYHLAHVLGSAAGLSDEVIERVWRGPGTASLRLRRLMERDVLPGLRGRFILAIEDADRLIRFPIVHDLFAMLRAWAESEGPGWERLRVVLTSGLPPLRLTAKLRSSPFNIGTVVQLEMLTPLAVGELAQQYEVLDNGALLQTVMERAGGHPMLTRTLLHSVAIARGAELRADEALAGVREELWSKVRAAKLESAVVSLQRSPELAIRPDEVDELLRLGLIAREHPPYNPLTGAVARLLRS